MKCMPWVFVFAFASGVAWAQSTRPVGTLDNPRQITDADRGPAIDPVALAASPCRALPFRSFSSFASGAYALADVWVYTDLDEPALRNTRLVYTYPDFYKPTWGEVFDHVARQMRCRWDWNPENRQFRFAHSDAPPFFGVTLIDGWRQEDRGLYVWHAPKDQPFGLDIYYYGHYTASEKQQDLARQVREHFALLMVNQWPKPPTLAEMQAQRIAGAEALYLRTATPRPGGIWRQWSFVVDGHAFMIVSAMPQEREAALAPEVDRMVASFKLSASTTQPTTRGRVEAD